MVPFSIGYCSSSASRTEPKVASSFALMETSFSMFARRRKCTGKMTRIIAKSVPKQKAQPEDHAQLFASCHLHRRKRTPGRRWYQNRHRIYPASQPPEHCDKHLQNSCSAGVPSLTPPNSLPPLRLRKTRSFPSGGKCSESLFIGTTY